MNECAFNVISSDEILSLFSQRGELKDCPPGVELFQQGRPVHDVHLLERGLVKFTHTTKHGNEMVTELRWPMRILGAAALISGKPILMTCATVTECRIYSLSAETFFNLLETNIEFSHHVLQTVSQQFYEQVLRRVQLGTVPALSRLANILLQSIPEPAPKPGEEIRLQLPMSHTDVAGFLAIAPSSLSRLLGQLERKGTIRRGKGWIYVTNIELLRQEAG